MKKFLLHLSMTAGVIVGVITLYLSFPAYILSFEYKIKDLMFMAKEPHQGNPNIVIVDIDEKSLKELGQWPWSRDMVAQLLKTLEGYGAAMIGLDIVFAEPDRSSPRYVFEKLGRDEENLPDYDEMLTRAIASTPTVTGYIFVMKRDGVSPENAPRTQAITIERDKPADSYLLKPYRAILNIPSIEANAYSSGYFNMTPDIDGIVRTVPLIMEYNGLLYPSLSLEMIRLALGTSKIAVQYAEEGIHHIEVGELSIPTDYFGKMRINYRGPQQSFRYLSAADIYAQRVPTDAIRGKIVLVGTSAAGLMDLRSTPLDNTLPGVEIHATMLDNMLNQDFLSKPVWVDGVDMLSVIALSLLTFALLLLFGPLVGFALFLALDITLVATHYVIMTKEGILLNTLLPLLAMNTLFVAGQVLNYFLESKLKEKIKNRFARKVSPAVMNDILKEHGDLLSGKEREITIFFSDMRNFTNISEALGNPQRLIRLLNTYMDPMTEIIVHSGGTVDKFIGDAIMAYWNAPLEVENHPDKAVEAALAQLYRLKELNAAIRLDPEFAPIVAIAEARNVPIIDIGIGINTGAAVVGEMGSSGRSDYTVIGDTINLFRFLDLVTVKGKKEPVEIWQIHDFDRPGTYLLPPDTKKDLREELLRYHEAIGLYRSGQFTEALAVLRTIVEGEATANPTVCKLYIERCEHYIQYPPESFNGVFTHTTKG